ncbi:type II toxin-antitoxin system Phd/YefM family antitoxin [Roseiflexus sp. RS-1]|jgi:PHD/YefM family antitoxin component YafN of YafNO toxin-antitoxin module|uniref:type II toxin-antitoxin system Phd/YefM family antitoxin n=1 Tax=Roseiflexus sp. (strain RS-1) TaxID=357808 RepID=UPI0000D827BA|nr:type II toxin-antitoxin system Phd/YefM family antitoxin [Roseiflexus sp. RS-1]ABQ92624.1 prevent-host-death family protein [Roseiflexus sp. RS-1]MBO9320815.1 type II toxin-antitoxin system Phd/YefM family antitoxin [Roseiflexus sp.]
MATKTISSTIAQNNFGRILDDVIQNDSRYVIKRRGSSQVILLSLSDFERLLAADDHERSAVGRLLREIAPVYRLGETVDEQGNTHEHRPA